MVSFKLDRYWMLEWGQARKSRWGRRNAPLAIVIEKISVGEAFCIPERVMSEGVMYAVCQIVAPCAMEEIQRMGLAKNIGVCK